MALSENPTKCPIGAGFRIFERPSEGGSFAILIRARQSSTGLPKPTAVQGGIRISSGCKTAPHKAGVLHSTRVETLSANRGCSLPGSSQESGLVTPAGTYGWCQNALPPERARQTAPLANAGPS
jgi:hypothetical protein